MNKMALLILFFLFYSPGKDIQAQELQPTDLLLIDFWVDGARIDDQTVRAFEKSSESYAFEPEEILLVYLYNGIGDIQQSAANDDTRRNLNKIIVSSSEIYGPGSSSEGLAKAALGMCDERTPSKAIPVCKEGVATIESIYGRECREWALAMTFLAYLYLESGQLSLAQSCFESVFDAYAAATPYYCMPSIVFLQTRAIDLSEQGRAEPALYCTETITRLLDLFISSQKELENAYRYLPPEYSPVSDYDMVGRTYVNVTYIYFMLKKYEETLIQVDRGMSVLERIGLENTYSYAALMNNKAEIYQAQQNVSASRQWFDKARIKLEQIGETRGRLYQQICGHLGLKK